MGASVWEEKVNPQDARARVCTCSFGKVEFNALFNADHSEAQNKISLCVATLCGVQNNINENLHATHKLLWEREHKANNLYVRALDTETEKTVNEILTFFG